MRHDRRPLNELTAKELAERAVQYAVQGSAARTADIRDAIARLADRYAELAAMREIEETQATRH